MLYADRLGEQCPSLQCGMPSLPPIPQSPERKQLPFADFEAVRLLRFSRSHPLEEQFDCDPWEADWNPRYNTGQILLDPHDHAECRDIGRPRPHARHPRSIWLRFMA